MTEIDDLRRERDTLAAQLAAVVEAAGVALKDAGRCHDAVHRQHHRFDESTCGVKALDAILDAILDDTPTDLIVRSPEQERERDRVRVTVVLTAAGEVLDETPEWRHFSLDEMASLVLAHLNLDDKDGGS